MNNWLIAKESIPYLLVLAALCLVSYFLWLPLAIIFFIILLFTGFFFRNPRRSIPMDAEAALSPADGRIISVTQVEEGAFPGLGPCWKVSIFLNIFNVHFNRAPLAGKAEQIQYVPGSFLAADKEQAGRENERNYVLFDTDKGKVLVVQIAGLIARRIVCYVKGGEDLKQGQIFGLIKFGSCTQIYLPLEYAIRVKAGDKVKGGLSIIGTYQYH